jgi:hypothetical protein
MNYDLYWPCICGHKQIEHGIVMDRLKFPFSPDGCVVQGGTHLGKYKDDCAHFRPMSNLEYLESRQNGLSR